MQAVSFDISGAFAAFRDPSVTTNQTVYYIPSKSAVVGILGAILGVKRDNMLGDLYSDDFLDLYANTKIGIKVNTLYLNKITLFTNHRSLKEVKTKPVKKELLENPAYTIYVLNEKRHDDLQKRLGANDFVYTPYLGHAYCPAVIKNPKVHDAALNKKRKNKTGCVILDESEPFSADFEFTCDVNDGSTVMVERHLHHYFVGTSLEKKVMRHWIPVKSICEVTDDASDRKISNFYDIDGEAVCLY